jgi:hypothetical protein
VPPADAKFAKAFDVGNLDVVDHEQVLERAAAADDDVVAEVVAANHHARQALHVARHVLQGRRALEDLARLHQEAGVLHFLGCLERGRGHGDGLLEVLHPGQRDFHGTAQPGAHVHRIAGERQALEWQDFQTIGARTQIANTKSALHVAGGTRRGVEGAHAHARSRLSSCVHHHAVDGAHPGGVLCRHGRREKRQHGPRDNR